MLSKFPFRCSSIKRGYRRFDAYAEQPGTRLHPVKTLGLHCSPLNAALAILAYKLCYRDLCSRAHTGIEGLPIKIRDDQIRRPRCQTHASNDIFPRLSVFEGKVDLLDFDFVHRNVKRFSPI